MLTADAVVLHCREPCQIVRLIQAKTEGLSIASAGTWQTGRPTVRSWTGWQMEWPAAVTYDFSLSNCNRALFALKAALASQVWQAPVQPPELIALQSIMILVVCSNVSSGQRSRWAAPTWSSWPESLR